MLEVKYLTKKYGAANALSSVSFRAEKGRIIGLLGPNGAGKSTIMSIIAGYTPKSGGKVLVCNMDTDENPSAVKRSIGYLPENTPLPLNMTVAEFLDFSSDLKKVPKAEKPAGIARATELAGLTEVRGRLIRNLSKGFRQRAGIAQALIGTPEVLLLDEPANGLDPSQSISMRELIRELGKSHTVLYSSHILREIEAVCDRVVLLYKGCVLADGPVSMPAASPLPQGFQLTSEAPQESISSALSAAGVQFTKLSPINSTLEDVYVRLISEAEQGMGNK